MNGYATPIGPEYAGRSLCHFMGSTPGQMQCENPATVHLWLVHAKLGDVCALACDDHVGVARQVAEVLDEHPFRGVCGLPGTIWSFDERLCFLDESGVELPAKVGVIEIWTDYVATR